MDWSTSADTPKSYDWCLTVFPLIEGCPRKRDSAKQALSILPAWLSVQFCTNRVVTPGTRSSRRFVASVLTDSVLALTLVSRGVGRADCAALERSERNAPSSFFGE